MSGRVRVTLADGRRVTGYRKTLTRRARRTPAHLLPDFTLSFTLPVSFAPAPDNNLGILGVKVGKLGFVEITGKWRSWVEGQAEAFLKKLGVSRVSAVIRRGDAPGPTISGPITKGFERVVTITVDRGRATVIDDTASRTLFGP